MTTKHKTGRGTSWRCPCCANDYEPCDKTEPRNLGVYAEAPAMATLLARAVADRIDDAWLASARAVLAKAGVAP